MKTPFMVISIITLPDIAEKIVSIIRRMAGLTDIMTRFQSRSAVTGTGFTTREPELIVNYPIARRVVTTLMNIGNLGQAPAICRMAGTGGSVAHAGSRHISTSSNLGHLLLLCRATER